MGGITLAGVRIADHKPFGLLTFREVIAKSSNVGTIKTALRVPNRELLRDRSAPSASAGTTGVDLPGESPGLLMPVERWPPLAKAYISFGQGISVTPLQLAAAFAAVGQRRTPARAVRRAPASGRAATRPRSRIRDAGRARASGLAAHDRRRCTRCSQA